MMSKELAISQTQIENRIFTVRGVQVMLDSDLAEMYQTETKYINRAMKRNPDRFPQTFAFQLTAKERENLRCQFGTSSEDDSLRFQSGTLNAHGGRRTMPYAFTEQGVAMLSAVLQTPIAVKVSVQIINVFVELRKLIASHSGLLQRVEGIEKKLIQTDQKQLETDQKIERVFKALEGDVIPTQGVFFNGQVFDAYELASKIIRSAKESIVLIDNWVDEHTLTHLSKKKKGVKVLVLTNTNRTDRTGRQLNLDIQKVNEQYGDFSVKQFIHSHDRFLIIDNGKEVYHIGASLKDLGSKWFAFSKMDKESVDGIINKISGLI